MGISSNLGNLGKILCKSFLAKLVLVCNTFLSTLDESRQDVKEERNLDETLKEEKKLNTKFDDLLEEGIKYKCQWCPFVGINKKSVAAHQSRYCSAKMKSNLDESTQEEAKKESNLDNLQDDEKSFKCQWCSFFGKNQKSLSVHQGRFCVNFRAICSILDD